MWVEDTKKEGPENVIIIIVGMKTDLSSSRTVSTATATALASKYNSMYLEASAKNGNGVSEVFNTAAAKALGIDAPVNAVSSFSVILFGKIVLIICGNLCLPLEHNP